MRMETMTRNPGTGIVTVSRYEFRQQVLSLLSSLWSAYLQQLHSDKYSWIVVRHAAPKRNRHLIFRTVQLKNKTQRSGFGTLIRRESTND